MFEQESMRNFRLRITAIVVAMAGIVAPLVAQTTESALALTPRPVVLRADDNSTRAQTLYTTDGPEFLRASLPLLPEPNKSIVQLMLEYPTDGKHTYWWPRSGESSYDGSTTDVILNGEVVMKGEPGARTFCCGLTLEVYYRYIANNPQAVQRITGDSRKFKGDWFCRNINSPGPLDALQATGLGTEVKNLDQALPGDFVQLWRNGKSGHSVIFVNWIKDVTGKKVGLQYWSTQTSTQGIGFASESFGPANNQINPEHFSVARPTI